MGSHVKGTYRVPAYNLSGLDLSDADVDAFSLLFEWLYTGSIRPPTSRMSVESMRRSISKNLELYRLAENLGVKDLADAAMDYIGTCYFVKDALPSQEDIKLAFRTMYGSTLRHYMCMAFRYILSTPCIYTEDDESVPSAETLWRLAEKHRCLGEYVFQCLRDGVTAPQHPMYELICDFHKHDADEPCPAAGKHFNDYIEPNLRKAHSVERMASISLSPPIPVFKLLGFARPPEQDGQNKSVGDKSSQASLPANTGGSFETFVTRETSTEKPREERSSVNCVGTEKKELSKPQPDSTKRSRLHVFTVPDDDAPPSKRPRSTLADIRPRKK